MAIGIDESAAHRQKEWEPVAFPEGSRVEMTPEQETDFSRRTVSTRVDELMEHVITT